MNITKELFESIPNRNFNQKFKFKCEKYSPMYKCNRILRQIDEVNSNIDHITTQSKKSSAFNDQHLKFASATGSIKNNLKEIENEMKIFQLKDMKNNIFNKFEKVIVNNSFDVLNNKTSILTRKFKKFLQIQTDLIKKVEERKNRLSRTKKPNLNPNKSYNEFINTNNTNDDEDILLNMAGQIQENKKETYYQSRLNNVQMIEKTMSEISSMMNRLGQMTYSHSLMIDNIKLNTDITYDNVESGAKEIRYMVDDVKGNRALLIKIFLIIIVVSVVYILFLA